jgi:hypothetical protein
MSVAVEQQSVRLTATRDRDHIILSNERRSKLRTPCVHTGDVS